MDLQTIWFLIVVYMFAGFLFLEGFDYGVGILLPFLSKEDDHRRMTLATIGGVWDGNEVWMVNAGAVLFAAFPYWYATLFSSMYLPLVLILFGLILRGVGIKFRSQREDLKWRFRWDWTICLSSLLAATLWGVAIGNFMTGIPVDADKLYAGGFWDLVTPFTVASGVAVVALFILHGATYLNIKLSGDILRRLQDRIIPIYLVVLLGAAAYLIYAAFAVGLLKNTLTTALVGGAVAALVACGLCIRRAPLAAFWLSGATIVFVGGAVFSFMYPRVLISSLNPAWSLTIYNASSSDYTLKVMSVVALIFIPSVLFYQGWTYWMLRKRIDNSDLHY